MREKIKRFFTEYSREKLLALIFTFVIWIFMMSGNSEVRDFSMKLNVIIEDDAVLVSDIIDAVHIKASGSIFDFAAVNEENLQLTVDLSGKKAGIHTRFLDASMMPFDDGIKIEKIFPSELVFQISSKAEKIVSVDPWLEGQPPLGWKLSGWEVDPEKIKVEGPENEVEELETITTERILLSSITKSIEKTVRIKSTVPLIKPVGEKSVKVKIEIERDIEIKLFSKVPVKLDSEIDAELTPAEISFKLTGPKNILQKMESSDLKVFVKDDTEKQSFKTDTFYIKGMSEEVELIKDQKPLEIKVKKVSK